MKLKIEIIFEFSLENDSNVYRVSVKIKKKRKKMMTINAHFGISPAIEKSFHRMK